MGTCFSSLSGISSKSHENQGKSESLDGGYEERDKRWTPVLYPPPSSIQLPVVDDRQKITILHEQLGKENIQVIWPPFQGLNNFRIFEEIGNAI